MVKIFNHLNFHNLDIIERNLRPIKNITDADAFEPAVRCMVLPDNLKVGTCAHVHLQTGSNPFVNASLKCNKNWSECHQPAKL